jgi:hypothetical protein
MSRQPTRQTFGLKNAKNPQPVQVAAAKASGSGSGGFSVMIHPMILAGGLAFTVAAAMVLMLGGQPQVQPGRAPLITEISGGTQIIPPKGSGDGKSGAANSALGAANR